MTPLLGLAILGLLLSLSVLWLALSFYRWRENACETIAGLVVRVSMLEGRRLDMEDEISRQETERDYQQQLAYEASIGYLNPWPTPEQVEMEELKWSEG